MKTTYRERSVLKDLRSGARRHGGSLPLDWSPLEDEERFPPSVVGQLKHKGFIRTHTGRHHLRPRGGWPQ